MGVIWHNIDELAARLAELRSLGYTIVATSGGFDCLHVGHLRCIQQSQRLGDELIVIVNADPFLERKKGYCFMKLEERLEIIAGLAGVDHVVPWDDGSQTVHGALELLRPHVFAKGGDRSDPSQMAPEELAVCARIGCRIEYGVGGRDKVQSSSSLVGKLKHH